MFGTLGFPEILFILVLALLVFGPKKLPEVGRTIGRALGEFRRATGDLKRSFDQEVSSLEAEPKSDRPPVVARESSDSPSSVPDSEPDVESEKNDDSQDRDEP